MLLAVSNAAHIDPILTNNKPQKDPKKRLTTASQPQTILQFLFNTFDAEPALSTNIDRAIPPAKVFASIENRDNG